MQQGGSPYGAPPPPPQQQQQQQKAELTPFHLTTTAAEAAPPISTRPLIRHGGTGAAAPNFEELGTGDDPLGGPGEEGSSGGLSGNRWPRQETLALLKIRSDMDAAFRDATLKGPLWEEVSRKLGELGYRRNAKKCKEKFENVHKYYKRTKEGRAGRQDGKSYRFFSQLEAMHNTTTTTTQPSSMIPSLIASLSPTSAAAAAAAAERAAVEPMQQISAPTPITTAPPPVPPQHLPIMSHENPIATSAAAAGVGFSSNSFSESDSESDEDDDEATDEGPYRDSGSRKRKREGGGGSGGGGTKKMMAFFEGLMRQLMERQESMQHKFLEAIEKRKKDRSIREEAWRRQELSRLAREHELAAQERAAAASRDAAILSFLQKVSGGQHHAVQLAAPQPPPPPPPPHQPPTNVIQTTPQRPPQPTIPPQIHTPLPQPTIPPQIQTPPPSQPMHHHHHHQTPPSQPQPVSTELVPVGSADQQEGSGGVVSVILDPASSRWPKSEVHALIKLRSGLDLRYQETGPKGLLWEEISAGMQRLGYNRSSKRCKEKWENINKYFKKVKESNKKRPEDAKTCPYFHQLDALYRNKVGNSSGGGGGGGSLPALPSPNQNHQNQNLNPNPSPISMVAPLQAQQQQGEMESKNGNGNGGNGDQTNGGIASSFFGEGSSGGGGGGDSSGIIMKKPEDIVKELMGHSNNNDYGNEPESDNMDEDDEEEEDDDEDGKGQYRIQFQNNAGSSGAPPNTGGKSSGSFLAMVR